MKKAGKFLAAILSLTIGVCSLSSCGDKGLKDADKALIEGRLDAETTIEINASQFEAKINNKDDFIIMLAQKTCGACRAFERVLDRYIKENDVQVYVINELVPDLVDYKYTPTLAIYREGEPLYKEDPLSDEEVFANCENLKKTIDKYAVVAPRIELSVDQLRNKITTGDSFVVFFDWLTCSDCAYMKEHFLDDYLRVCGSKMKPVYTIECDEWRKNKPSKKPEPTDEDYETQLAYWNKWIDFAIEFEFVDYEYGKIPTVHYYENGQVKDSFVYLNDIATYKPSADGSYEMTITGSFFSDNPYIGKTMSLGEYKETVGKKFYNPKLEKFLNAHTK